ncbi:hypothetical protein PENTCL1PPCAC_11436 [Pristionchus entomophagus]|uniref:Pseudouridylate synthase RPUSD4, mitochondrial n=1 Tax=Pristionchus entomophagus TaxID=358040 RepID=A0AAV5T0Z5_9BILA|nr:hypothetical protein PENTCL1PPCAC_11436 [Pristionchus entomophagus]
MSAADDFFGIEYIQSTSFPSGKNEEKKEERRERSMEKEGGEGSIERYSVMERREWSEMDTEKMSGTQFIDAAFFPELKEKNGEGEWKRGEDGTKNIWEERTVSDHRHSRMEEVKEKRSEKRPKERQERVVMSQSQSEEERKRTGLDEIRSQYFPFWNLTENQMIEALCERVVFNDGEMLAINKPKGIAYSGEKDSTKYQLDRLASRVKEIILPKAEKLHPVLTLDKEHSGIVLFTTNHFLRSELVERMRNEEITIKTDCIVRGMAPSAVISIQTPLVKSTKGSLKMWPAREGDGRGIKVKSGVRKMKGTEAHSHVEVETTSEIPHQIRAHLSLMHLPLLGDQTYGKKRENDDDKEPMRYPSQTLTAFGISRNQSSKMPMFIHRREISIPSIIATKPGVSIMAPLPPHFTLALKKLSLLRKIK